MPYQVQGIDLPSIFLAAQQARANEMRMREMQRQEQIAAELPQARQAYFGGDPTLLQRLAPDEAMKIADVQSEMQRKREQLRLNEENAKREEQYRQAQLQNAKLDEAARAVLNSTTLQPGTPEYQQAYVDMRAKLEQEEVARRRAGATSINIGKDGAIGLTQGVQAAQQTAVLGTDAVLAQLDEIDRLAKDAGGHERLLTGGSQLKARAAGIVDKIAPALTSKATEKELQRHESFTAANQAMVNEYVKMMTGSGVTGSDLERALAAIPNANDSPTVYRSKMQSLRQRLEQARKLGVGALVGGIQLDRQATGKSAPSSPDGNPVGAVSFTGQQLPPTPAQATRREPGPQAAAIDISAPAAGPPSRVPSLEIPPSIAAGPDLSGAAGVQAPPPQQQAQRREPAAQAAQPKPDIAVRGEQIVSTGLSGGKTPPQIADELIKAGILRPANRAKAIENLNRRLMKLRGQGR